MTEPVLSVALVATKARIFGLLNWASDWDAAYDIEAKTETPIDVDECRDLARQMLFERFRMVSHEETRAVKSEL